MCWREVCLCQSGYSLRMGQAVDVYTRPQALLQCGLAPYLQQQRLDRQQKGQLASKFLQLVGYVYAVVSVCKCSTGIPPPFIVV
jgi:hypothetical protein